MGKICTEQYKCMIWLKHEGGRVQLDIRLMVVILFHNYTSMCWSTVNLSEGSQITETNNQAMFA